MNRRNDAERAQRRADKMRLSDAVLSIAICGDEGTAKCASKGELRAAWKHLRRRAKQIRKESGRRVVVMRTECLGVCRFGPVAAIFPPGAWYGGCDGAVLDRILDAHLGDADAPRDHLIAAPSSAPLPDREQPREPPA